MTRSCRWSSNVVYLALAEVTCSDVGHFLPCSAQSITHIPILNKKLALNRYINSNSSLSTILTILNLKTFIEDL